jgi:integrase
LERPRRAAIATSSREKAASQEEKKVKTQRVKPQRGQIFRVKRSWYGRWRRDEIETAADGSRKVVRRQHAEKLCEYGDRYRTRKDVQPLLDAKLRPLNEGRCAPESTLTVAEYGDKFFLPYCERELKPSTVYGYKGLWRMYLKPRLAKVSLRDFRCVDATNLLASIHDGHGLSRKSLRHCKALLSTTFTHAKRAGVLDGENPVKDAGIPRAAKASKATHAYSAEEVFAMLDALNGTAKLAVALIYFCALRPGEARAARWEDYDGKTLRVRASMWRNHTTLPKTAESIAPVPVAQTLSDILRDSRRDCGFILASPLGKPVDLHNLAARVVVPALARCAKCGEEKDEHDTADHEFKPLPEWHGWYALRRGLATLATSIDSQLAAKSLLRHSSVQTTQQFYIKSVPEDALRAVKTMDALFQKSATAVPN